MKHLLKKADFHLLAGRANLNKHTNPCLYQKKALVFYVLSIQDYIFNVYNENQHYLNGIKDFSVQSLVSI